MKSISEIRRDNLKKLVDETYSGRQVSAARALGVSASLLNRWLKEKSIGTASARKIEIGARKPNCWLDQDRTATDENNDEALVSAIHENGELNNVVDIFAHNIRTLMNSHQKLNSQGKLAKAAGIAQASVGRAVNKEASINISIVEAIAKAYGMRAFELLIPPKDPDTINYDRAAYTTLSEEDKAAVERFIEFQIAKSKEKPE